MKKRFNIQETDIENHQQYKERRLPKIDFQFLGEEKYRTNKKGVFFDVETLELDVLNKLHDMYLDYDCSNNCSTDPVSEIKSNRN